MLGGSAIHELFMLERFLPFRLSRLAGRLTDRMAAECCRPFGLSLPEWRVLALLGQHGSLPGSGIMAWALLDKARMSRAVNCLVDLGYIKRRLMLGERRRLMLELTRSGRQVYEQAVPLALALQERLLSAVADDERAIFWQALLKLEAQHGVEPPAPAGLARGEPHDTSEDQPAAALAGPLET